MWYVFQARVHLVLPVVSLAVLYNLVAQLEQIADVLIPLVCKVCHGKERFATL